MGRGGQKQENGRSRVLTWDEIRTHDSRNDRWLVIGGQVYDVTKWAYKHPGGSKLISHYAGQDATDAFGAFHKDVNKVNKYLGAFHIGEVEDYKDREIDRDFRELRQTAVKAGYFNPSYTFFGLMAAHIIGLEILSYYTLIWFGTGWIPYLTCLALYSTSQVQSGWSHHDYGHLSVFDSFRLNRLGHHFMIGFWKGCSSHWWNHLHYQHHAKPNIMDKDPDVRLDKLFVVGDVMPVQVAKTRQNSMPFNIQHRYFFAIGPPLLFPVYFQIMYFRHVFTRKLWTELAIISTYFARYLLMFLPILGVTWTIIFYFTVRCIESHWFVWVAQSNHIPMTIQPDESDPWLKLQLGATCDIEKSFFNDWFTGHLNFQIEHHLFPTMPRHNLYKVAPLVKSLCKKHDIPYVVKPLWQSFVDIYKTLKTSGQLWEHSYKEFYSG